MSFLRSRSRHPATIGQPRAPAPTPSAPPIGADVRDGRAGPFLALVVAVVLVLWLARAVIGPFVVAGVIAYAFSPVVAAGERRTGLPRIAVVGIGYLVALGLLAALLYAVAGSAASELTSLRAAGPDAVATTLRGLVGADAVDIFGQQVSVVDVARELQDGVTSALASPGDAIHMASLAGEVALNALLALIVTFYLLLDGGRFMERGVQLVPEQQRARVELVLGRIHAVLGKWLRGQLLLVGLVALVVYLVLGPILHMPYALAIGILTGILEVLPLVGPLIATAIAGVDAFAHGGSGLAAGVVVFYFVLRQIEDQVVMPIVIGRAVHLHPVVTIFAVLVGLSTFGVLGGLLGVPIAAAANVVFNELYPAPASRDTTASGLPGPSGARLGDTPSPTSGE